MMRKSIFAIAILLAMTLPLPRHIYAGSNWRVTALAASGNDYNKLTFGIDDAATDGFDAQLEIGAFLAGNLYAYFYHPEWGDVRYLWQDIRDTGLPEDWEFYVASSYGNMTISWELAGVPGDVSLSLRDDLSPDIVIDMKAQSSYAYLNNSNAPRLFKFTAIGQGVIVIPDVSPPETVITQTPSAITGDTVTIAYAGTDDVTPDGDIEFSYAIDGGGWSEWSKDASTTSSGLADGSRVFAVKARDAAGNVDPTPASVGFIVDRTPPQLTLNAPNPSILWPPDGRMRDVEISGSAVDGGSGLSSVDYTVTDEYGEFASSGAVNVSNGGFSFKVSLKAWRNRADLDGRVYTITVIAVDKVGNEKSASAAVKVHRSTPQGILLRRR